MSPPAAASAEPHWTELCGNGRCVSLHPETAALPVCELHPDNGPEFLNHHLQRFWKEELKDVQLSRSGPYHKNDSSFVEQRNANPVRAYLGYDRLDTVAQTLALNGLYDKM
jgi:hypothetical protein